MNDLIELLRGRRIDGRSADEIMRLAADEIESLRSRLAAMQQSMDEVRPFTDKIAARLAEVESRLNLADAEVTMLRHFNAEADALLREEIREHHRFTQMTEYPSVTRMLLWHMDRKRRIDAHLSRKEQP